MKHFQNWLQLQHYQQHLKRLQDIKYRSASKFHTCHKQKSKTKTIHRGRNSCDAYDYIKEKQGEGSKLGEQKKSLKIQEQKHFKCLQQGLKGIKKGKSVRLKRIRFNSDNEWGNDQEGEQKVRESTINISNISEKTSYSPCKSQQQATKNSSESFSQKQNSQKIYKKSTHFRMKSQIHEFTQNQSNLQQTKNAKSNWSLSPFTYKNKGAHRRKQSRESQLEKYIKFSEQKFVKAMHSYTLELKITSISFMPNSSLLSFWIQVQTYEQKIKSSCMSFQELAQKSIYFSFMKKTKGPIYMKVKYFRNLQKYMYGDYMFTPCKQEFMEQKVIISQRNTTNRMQITIRERTIQKENLQTKIKKKKKPTKFKLSYFS